MKLRCLARGKKSFPGYERITFSISIQFNTFFIRIRTYSNVNVIKLFGSRRDVIVNETLWRKRKRNEMVKRKKRKRRGKERYHV